MRRSDTKGGGDRQLYFPNGLCFDSNGDVYVADNSNNRVSVFSEELKFLNCLGTQQLEHPHDVNVTPDSVIVLDSSPNCIHFFSRRGELLRSFVTQGEDDMVYGPRFFCLDAAGNVLTTDRNRHCFKVLSPSGQLIHTIGKKVHGRGELFLPIGISVTQSGTIFVVSNNDNSCLQSF